MRLFVIKRSGVSAHLVLAVGRCIKHTWWVENTHAYAIDLIDMNHLFQVRDCLSSLSASTYPSL